MAKPTASAGAPLFDQAPGNQPEYSVSELSRALKQTIEGRFESVRVRGEISGFKRAASGHCYFSLKDDKAVLDAVCWRDTAIGLGFEPEDGLEVVATGRLTTYAQRSRYQLVIDRLAPAGVGALMALLEQRRRQLAAEGLFDDGRKRPLPYLPAVIGVVTSPTGAVIRDILHRLADRFPRRVLVWPVLVQGEGAAAQVAAAIRGFNALGEDAPVPRPDLLIVARGGGSIEDLWAFNEEIVVRAAAASDIPLVSAVGHETDTTLIDFAADRRAPTPTAAAEMAVPVRAELAVQLKDLERRQAVALQRLVGERRRALEGLARGLRRGPDQLVQGQQRLDDLGERLRLARRNLLGRRADRLAAVSARLQPPRNVLALAGQRLAECGRALDRAARVHLRHEEQGLAAVAQRLRPGPIRTALAHGEARRQACATRLDQVMQAQLGRCEERLAGCGRLLESLSYRRVLARGFAVVRRDGRPVTAAGQTVPGQRLRIEFRDGETPVLVEGTPPRRRSSTPGEGQGDLF